MTIGHNAHSVYELTQTAKLIVQKITDKENSEHVDVVTRILTANISGVCDNECAHSAACSAALAEWQKSRSAPQ